jgi:hypothetical protein
MKKKTKKPQSAISDEVVRLIKKFKKNGATITVGETTTNFSKEQLMKIVTTATIKDAKIKVEGADLCLEGIPFNGNQYKEIAQLIKDQEQIQITIEPIQGRLINDEADDDK